MTTLAIVEILPEWFAYALLAFVLAVPVIMITARMVMWAIDRFL